MKRFLLYILTGIATVWFSGCSQERPAELDIMVLYTSQMYGHYLSYDLVSDQPTSVSLANFSSFVKEQKAIYGDRCIVIDNGNMMTRGPVNFYSDFIDTLAVPIANQVQKLIGYDVVSLGESDLRRDEPFICQRHDSADYPPIVCMNVLNRKSGAPYFRPWTCIERAGIRIAITAVVDEEADQWTPELGHPDAVLTDMKESLRRNIMQLRKECKPDLVICIVNSYKDLNLQHDIPGIDLVLNSDFNGQSPMTHAGSVRIHLLHDSQIDRYFKMFVKSVIDLEQYDQDQAYVDHFKDYLEVMREKFNEQFGNIPEDIFTSYGIFSLHDYYRDLLHQAQLWYSKADISFTNIANPYAVIEHGAADLHKVFTIFNHENVMANFWMTGREIHALIEWASTRQFNTIHSLDEPMLARRYDKKGHQMWSEEGKPYLLIPESHYLSVGGLNYSIDLSKQPGSRVTITSLRDGRPFDPDASYSVVSNSYMLSKILDFSVLHWSKYELMSRLLVNKMPSMRYVLYSYLKDCPGAYTPDEDSHGELLPQPFCHQAARCEHERIGKFYSLFTLDE